MIKLTPLSKFFRPQVEGVNQEEQAARQAKLDDHVFNLHKYIAQDKPSQALRFLQVYARLGEHMGDGNVRLESVLGQLKNAGYTNDVETHSNADPESFAKFAVSSLIRDMKKLNLPPHPYAANGLVDGYHKLQRDGVSSKQSPSS